jgi:DNA-directed RNA polymerase specialized sigma24 family protein
MTVSEFDWEERKDLRGAAARGEEAAWAVLFAWLWPWTVQQARSADGAMEGWLKIIRNPLLWLAPLRFFVVIFKHAGDDEERRERRHRGRIEAFRASGSTGVQPASDAELNAILAQTLGKLSPDHRRVAALYFEGFSIRDISERDAMPYPKTRVLLRMALAALRDIIRGNDAGLAAPAG